MYTWVCVHRHTPLCTCVYIEGSEKQAGEQLLGELCADCGVTRKKDVSLADTHPCCSQSPAASLEALLPRQGSSQHCASETSLLPQLCTASSPP